MHRGLKVRTACRCGSGSICDGKDLGSEGTDQGSEGRGFIGDSSINNLYIISPFFAPQSNSLEGEQGQMFLLDM